MNETNDHLVLICGMSAAGKSASLRNLQHPEGVMYLNCEAGKKLPFPNKFKTYTITDPYQVLEAFDAVATGKITGIHTIIVDSLTFLLDMFESVHVIPSPNTMTAWGAFQQYFKTLMQDKVAKSACNVIFTAHTLSVLNENEMVVETKVPVKGALKNNGIEAYFSCVVAAKKVPIKKLDGYKSNLLEITPEEEALGFKYVFQTKLTKDTVNERIRSPMGMFSTAESYMDNDAQKLLTHLNSYYN
jgi:hypothetical protein